MVSSGPVSTVTELSEEGNVQFCLKEMRSVTTNSV
jgi:hypothetical protein